MHASSRKGVGKFDDSDLGALLRKQFHESFTRKTAYLGFVLFAGFRSEKERGN